MTVILDDTDRRMLRRWQGEPSLTVLELADLLGLSNGQVTRRLERLRSQGVLRGVRGVVDWRRLGYAVEVSLRITLDKTQRDAFDRFLDAAREVPAVLEIQTFLGKVDVRLSVIARDLAHYQSLYRTKVLTLPHIADIEALMHVAHVKHDETLPL